MNFPANKPTFTIKTLGCKVNQYESQAMREDLVGCGFAEETGRETADFFIINSCTVTGKADKDTRSLIRHFHRINPKGKIVVAGCYAELDSDRKELAGIAGVAYLVRNREKGRIAEILSISGTGLGLARGQVSLSGVVSRRDLSPPKRPIPAGITDFKDRNRAFVKIQDGCDHRCSYCKVSIVRGPSRSRCPEEIVKEVRSLVEKGFKEIVLTGVSLGAHKNLAGLISEISRLEGSFRIRLSSIEPGYVTDALLGAIKSNSKMCKHLHIPLQSGDDRILRLMKRPYNTKRFAGIIKKIRKHIPDAAITTDVLVGFPGEDERHFRKTVRFIKKIRPSRMHVFPYSRREGTAAAKLSHSLSKQEVKERVKILTDLSKYFSLEFAKRFIGKPQEVLIESQRDRSTGLLTGYTDRYVRVLTDGPDLFKNCLVSVRSRSPCLDNTQII
ncbi:MAG: tRNA (N(6)-L-threonylcarbamoyladenosine(37)-C(2))-methylthiotransferase MtaB [Candidatus Omnitrophota bacterium]